MQSLHLDYARLVKVFEQNWSSIERDLKRTEGIARGESDAEAGENGSQKDDGDVLNEMLEILRSQQRDKAGWGQSIDELYEFVRSQREDNRQSRPNVVYRLVLEGQENEEASIRRIDKADTLNMIMGTSVRNLLAGRLAVDLIINPSREDPIHNLETLLRKAFKDQFRSFS